MKKHIIFSTAMIMTLSLASCGDTVKNAEISSDSQSSSADSEDTVIHLATALQINYIDKAVKEFNEADNGYRIEIIEYDHTLDASEMLEGTANSLDLTDFELIQSLINTTEIDLVASWAFAEESNYRLLQQKGAFADMYKFMENDDEINTQTLNSHVLQLNEIDGELRSIPTFYTANALGGNPDYVGTKINWTIDELISHWEKMPDNATIHGGRTKEWAYYQVVRESLMQYVDFENAKVYFDSPDFRKALEFCNTFDYNDRQKTDYDYDAPDFCYECNIFSFSSLATLDFGSENPKIAFVGYPSSNGKGAYLRSFGQCFSISAKADENKQKGAWEFIRTFFTEEWQEENALSYSDRAKGYASENAFCMNKQANENIKNNVVNKKYSPPTFESKGETFTTYFPTLEDCNALEEYLNTIDRWEVNIPTGIYEAITEEIFTYFAGEISIDECIDRIQSRTSIWISEQS